MAPARRLSAGVMLVASFLVVQSSGAGGTPASLPPPPGCGWAHWRRMRDDICDASLSRYFTTLEARQEAPGSLRQGVVVTAVAVLAAGGGGGGGGRRWLFEWVEGRGRAIIMRELRPSVLMSSPPTKCDRRRRRHDRPKRWRVVDLPCRGSGDGRSGSGGRARTIRRRCAARLERIRGGYTQCGSGMEGRRSRVRCVCEWE